MNIDDAAVEAVRSLVATYKENRSEYLRQEYNETSLRVDFLNPFFKILGWDVNNERGLSIYAREVIHESNVTVEEGADATANKKPDYAFRVSGETKFFLEAKKPSVNIIDGKEPAFQARRYGWSANHRIVVLSNFEDTTIYDCSYKPKRGQAPSFARIAHYHYDELVTSFDQIAALLSKEAVLGGVLDAIDASESVEKEPFDNYFLSRIRSWRYEIAKDIVGRYPGVTSDDLNRFVQNLINRILFLRVCEDRSFEEPGLLLNISSFSELEAIFSDADEKYDSGLFDYLSDAKWGVSDAVLTGIFKELYYPNNSYQFNVVQPYVIGRIYEQFLGDRLVVADGWIMSCSSRDASDADGVVPTPKEIADIIVGETLEGREVPCRVADICCGSGNFLLSSYEFLLARELDRLMVEQPNMLIERQSGYDLPFSKKREILTTCIYGVDINPLAVEVAKLNLQLRLLEGCAPGELDAYMAATGNKILPDLSDNIKCGNSIVGTDYYDYDPAAIGDIEKLRSIRPFDWDAEFAPSSFDAIVGNPPYVRVQNMKKYGAAEYNFIKSDFCELTTTKSALVDKYQIFIERALTLLDGKGTLGMIVPNKFLTIKTGASLRNLLSNAYSIWKLIDFGANQVFDCRETYTCIFVATPKRLDSFFRQEVTSLSDFIASPARSMHEYPSSLLGADPWCFPPVAISDHLKAVEDRCVPLNELAQVFVGLQTSNDSVYIFEPKREENDCFVFDSSDGHEAAVEKYLCRPCLLDVVFEPYAQPSPNKMLIFPYENHDGKPSLIPLSRIRIEAPHAYAYFKSVEESLRRRSMKPAPTDETWHRFGRSQSLNRFSGEPHIVWTVMSLGPKYEIDYTGKVMFTGGGNGPYYGMSVKPETGESIEYILAVLCYWLTEALVKSRTSVFRGAYYSHGKQFIEVLPVRQIDFSSPVEVKKHAEITDGVRKIVKLIAARDACDSPNDIILYRRSICAAQSAITRMMNELYEIDESFERATTG